MHLLLKASSGIALLLTGGLTACGLLAAVLWRMYRLKIRTEREIAQKNRDLEALDAIVQSINRQEGLKGLAWEIVDKGRSLIPQADRICLLLLDAGHKAFRMEALWSVHPEEVELFSDLRLSRKDAQARYTRPETELEPGMFLLRKPGPLPACEHLAHLPEPKATLAMSIEIESTLEGFLVLDHLSDPEAFHRSGVQRLVRLREHAISAIAKARAMEKLERAKASSDKAMARLQAEGFQKDQMLGIAAHDLRNPLNSIVSSAQLLEGETSPDRVRQIARYIQKEGMEMSALIGRFLDSAALESGNVKAEPRVFFLRSVAQQVLERHERAATGKRIALKLVSCDGPVGTQADPRFTKEVLDNLVSNALKFSPPGTCVTVRLEERDGEVLLSVDDQGPGLTAKDKKQLFGRFARLSAKPTAGEKSTGLGLSIVKQMVDAMGGRVWAESEPGYGASFRVALPAAELGTGDLGPVWDGLRQAHVSTGIETHPRLKGRVLLADDNETGRLMAERTLQSFGLSVLGVDDGLKALAALRREAFELVLLDGNMPGLNGPATVAEIRRKEAEAGSPRQPVVALTGLARASDREWLRQAGFDEVLSKPMDRAALWNVLARFLGKVEPVPEGAAAPGPHPWDSLALALGGREAFRELLETFLSDSELRVVKLLRAAKSGDRERLSREAHDLKSNARTFHFEHLADISLELEQRAADMGDDELDDRISRLSSLMEDVRSRCGEYLRG